MIHTESLAVKGMPNSGNWSNFDLSLVFAINSSIFSASFNANGLIWTTEFVYLLTSSILSK